MQYDINLWFCFALQLMGVGGEYAAILASFHDLPEPHKWHQFFNVTEKFTHEALQKVFETDRLVHCPQASYDMGWQVRSSGGRNASPTGHGMLIGLLKKKVLDSIVYNKKCDTYTVHCSLHSNYDNVKSHKCVRNYTRTSKAIEAAGLSELRRSMVCQSAPSFLMAFPLVGLKHNILAMEVNCPLLLKSPSFWAIHLIRKGFLPEPFTTWLQLLKRLAKLQREWLVI
jgi:hypothetical protein